MNRSLVALWTLLSLAIAAIAVLAQLWIAQRAASTEQRVRDILQTQLVPLNDSIDRVLQQYATDLQRALAAHDLGSAVECIELARSPITQAIFVVNADDELHYPTHTSNLNIDQSSLLAEAYQLLREYGDPRPKPSRPGEQELTASNNAESAFEVESATRSRVANAPLDAAGRVPQTPAGESRPLRARSYGLRQSQEPSGETSAETRSSQLAAEPPPPAGGGQPAGPPPSANEPEAPDAGFTPRAGWVTWYHRRGMILGFLWNQPDGFRCMLVLPRARWMADIVAALPSSEVPVSTSANVAQPAGLDFSSALKQLVDIEGNVVYQWGNTPVEAWPRLDELSPDAELPVAQPLEGWRLRIFADPQLQRRLAGDSIIWPLWLAVVGMAAALVLGGLFVTLNLNRQMQLATQRVSFVNHVSHELRTPLTNIRMYADMLAHSLEGRGDEAERQLQRVEVIQHESQRLSRLIANVLRFARTDKQDPAFRLEPVVLDTLVSEVVDTFRPRLEQAEMEIALSLHAATCRKLDRDAVEQILVNLIGNAEKYASSGGYLRVATQETEDSVRIEVEDHGPGITSRQAQSIFEPFTRGSDRLQDPAGTGIGLTIVRELASKHGGTCELVDSPRGALFRCSLRARRAEAERHPS